MLVLIGIFLLRTEASFFSAFWRTTISSPVPFLVTTGVMLVVRVLLVLRGDGAGRGARPGHAGADRGGPSRRSRRDMRVEHRLRAAVHAGARGWDAVGPVPPQPRGDRPGSRAQARHMAATRPRSTCAGATCGLPSSTAPICGARTSRARIWKARAWSAPISREARLACADVSELILSEDRAKARCVKASGANLTRAKLPGARLAGIDLRGARLEEANLEGADLSYAIATGANFSSAHLERVGHDRRRAVAGRQHAGRLAAGGQPVRRADARRRPVERLAAGRDPHACASAGRDRCAMPISKAPTCSMPTCSAPTCRAPRCARPICAARRSGRRRRRCAKACSSPICRGMIVRAGRSGGGEDDPRLGRPDRGRADQAAGAGSARSAVQRG